MKKLLFLLSIIFALVACEDRNVVDSINVKDNSPLIGTTYKSIGEDWESYTFSENRYERKCQSWIDNDIQWLGYYELKDDTIYCYYDKLPLKTEFTMIYMVDSIIKGNQIYYKQK